MADDVVYNKISLDEPTQLLSIIFDVSSAWYTEFIPYIPPQHRQSTRQILSQLYFDTIGQICIFINTFLTLNKRNLIHFVAVNDERSIVLQQPLSYVTVPLETTTSATTSTTTTTDQNSNTRDMIFPTAIWVDPDRLPCPAQATDELFGTASSDIYSKLLLLNPFQLPQPSSPSQIPTTTSTTSTPTTRTATSTTRTVATIPSIDTSTQNFVRLFTGAFTKALCFINKAKQYDQSLSPHILIFSLSPFQGASGYMSCALYASRINCLVDTICINHKFGHHDLHEDDFKPARQKLSNLLTPLINDSIQSPPASVTTPDRNENDPELLKLIKKPHITPALGCHCEPHQQSSHITNGCSLYMSSADMNTLVQLYSETYAMSGQQQQQQQQPQQQKITNSTTTMNDQSTENIDTSNTSMESTLFKPQDYLYLLSLLQTHCLSNGSIRQHLITPSQTSVTLTAPCFCHPSSQNQASSNNSSRYLCNVCLVVVCKPFPQCPNCKSRFVTSRLAVPLLNSANPISVPNSRPQMQQPPQQQQQQQQQQQGQQQPPQQQPQSQSGQQPPNQTSVPPSTAPKPPTAVPKPAAIKPGKINIALGKR